MPRPQISFLNVLPTPIDADEVEQRIIAAYLRLAFQPLGPNGSRTLTIVRQGEIEARLTEMPSDASGISSYSLEIFSYRVRSVIDRRCCFEFDETELADAVNLVLEALHRIRVLQ